ncbi:hypothetical protein ACFXP3_01410 [Streptomyces sp. NPDC059096]|uniref:hypothetical protein n=1 Tax=Streptomyces sp. NPDC059096 TaxID=3346727 RepID=UPI0036BA5FB9
MPTLRSDLSAFARALAARLPDRWTSTYDRHAPYKDQFETSRGLWDSGHVAAVAHQYVLGHHAILHGPDGLQLYVADRPLRRRQFVVAALEPEGHGIRARHFTEVDDPSGIAVPDDPARATAQVTRRLLPRYQAALNTVRHNAATHPEPPHRPGPPQVARVVTLTWYEDGALGAPYESVPEDARMTLYSLGFQYRSLQAAFLLPASYGEDGRALRLRALTHQLAEKGIGVNLRHATTPAASPTATSTRPPVAPQVSSTVRHR